MTVDLQNKVTFITGACGAIGSEIVKKFAENGSDIVMNDVTDLGSEDIMKHVKDLGRKVHFLKGDISKRDETEEMVREAVARFGKIDVLINNAGVNVPKEKRLPVGDFSDEEWQRILDIDLTGTYYCSKPIIREMIKRAYGKIINISSVVGVVALRNQCAFAAAKAGVVNLTRAWALELASHGINVNVIAPGSILMEKTKATFYSDKAMADSLLSHIPLGRPGKPDDISNAALFLASDTSNYITGALLVVDGGWTCGYSRDW
jgi:3-oxoacyl-[acyl-carrier protein] reductase